MIRYKLIIRLHLLAIFIASNSLYAGNRPNEPILPLPEPQNANPALIQLGEKLFHDTRFSSDQKTSCASCHSLMTGGADGNPMSRGANDLMGNINTPTVFNSSLNFKQFWDGRASNLSEQMEGPIHSKVEMNTSWPRILQIIQQDPSYLSMFANSFLDRVTRANVKAAIVAFEESLLTPNSRFDQYLQGDEQAITRGEKRGYGLFKSYGCVSCHQGVNIGGNLFQKLGIVYEFPFGQSGSNNRDLGRFNVTKDEDDKHVFIKCLV